jgi:hypothetical protein
VFAHLRKRAALFIRPFEPPCSSGIGKAADDFLTLRLITEGSCTARNDIKGTGARAMPANVFSGLRELMRLKPKRGPVQK